MTDSFPDLDEDRLRYSAGTLAAELHACLAANARVREARDGAGDQAQSNRQGVARPASLPIPPYFA